MLVQVLQILSGRFTKSGNVPELTQEKMVSREDSFLNLGICPSYWALCS
jgi:hypothetical protein